MMLAWIYWWWDPVGLARAQVVAGFTAAILAVIAVVYAWRVAREQMALMREQSASSKRQEQIALKQEQIAEKQDRIMQEQLARRAIIRLGFNTQHRHEGSPGTPINVDFAIKNEGNRSADGCMWEILWPAEHQRCFWFVDEKDHEVPFRSVTVGDRDYFQLAGHYQEKLFPGGVIVVARVHINSVAVRQGGELYFWWRTTCEDGVTPSEGLGEVVLIMRDKYFAFDKNLRVS